MGKRRVIMGKIEWLHKASSTTFFILSKLECHIVILLYCQLACSKPVAYKQYNNMSI